MAAAVSEPSRPPIKAYSFGPNSSAAAVVSAASAIVIATAHHTSSLARSFRPDPSARATAVNMPPPIAPADTICSSMNNGKTSAMAARASRPSLATKYVSMSPIDVCTAITITFGSARRKIVGKIGASSSRRVRKSMVRFSWE